MLLVTCMNSISLLTLHCAQLSVGHRQFLFPVMHPPYSYSWSKIDRTETDIKSVVHAFLSNFFSRYSLAIFCLCVHCKISQTLFLLIL